MLSVAELKQKACGTIEAHRDELIDLAKDILAHPEVGFSETRTARLVADGFDRLGIQHRDGLALTGVKGRIIGGAGEGPRLGILGELDSLVVQDHPFADGGTGAAHACGHNCQIGMMLGASMGLLTPEVLSQLSGEIVPFAVPAEEFIDVEQRLQLREEGRVELLGGKQELIRLGEFDDVDLAMMCHTASDMGQRKFAVGGTSNGHVVKFVEYTGRGAHAGSAPHLGINALNAASFALQAIHANRETHLEQDTVRIHGIITRGGEAVNAVPADVRLEWRVRSGSPDAVVKNSAVVGPVLQGGRAGRGRFGKHYQHPRLSAPAPRQQDAGVVPGKRCQSPGRVLDPGNPGATESRRFHGHGGPEPDDAGMPPLHGRGRRGRPQQGLRDSGL